MREKLMDIVCESIATDRCVAYCSHPHCGLVHTVVQKLIANGVTIPVRCKDCKKRYKPNKCPMCILVYGEQHDFTQENGYCDRGERRTDD